jgi:hypothetical protein
LYVLCKLIKGGWIMKGFILLTLLSVIFVSDYAMAQGCPCDTLELPDGLTGNDIVEILCPGGELGEGNFSRILDDRVEIGGEGLGYSVIFPPGETAVCDIVEANDGSDGSKLADQEVADCRARLIRGCNLKLINPIPTLSQWGMIATAGVLGIIGLFVAVRRRKAAA